MLVNVNSQITMPHHLGAKRPLPERGARRFAPQTIIWALKIIHAQLLVYVTGYRILGARSTFKEIALSDSVG